MSRSESEDDLSNSEGLPISTEWLEAILKEHYMKTIEEGDMTVSVIDFTVRPGCDTSECVLSDILAVKVDFCITTAKGNEELDLQLIVKLLPQDPFSRYFVTEAQFDLREIKFYTQIVPELERFQDNIIGVNEDRILLPIPLCYHAKYTPLDSSPRASPVPNESVIVLENLKYQGYIGADFSKGLTLSQTEAALQALAKLHALSLAIKVKEGQPLSEKYPFLFQTVKATDSYQQLVERGLPQLTKFLEKRPGMEKTIEKLSNIRPHTKELIAALLTPEEPIALITHTDFWCNNLLFNEDKCAILDWQMVTYSRPTNDIALVLISSVSTELRRKHTVPLLDFYWSHFNSNSLKLGIDIENDLCYDRARLSEDYRRSQLLALLLCIGSVDVALGDPLTEQRLLDVLVDLNKDGVLSPDIIPKQQLSC